MDTPRTRQRVLMLALATIGFAVNFWAWALLSPLAPKFKDVLHLSSFQQALLVAVPVVVGSLGRIPVGALTDRFGGRIMFPLVSLTTIVRCCISVSPGTPHLPGCWSAGSSSASAAPRSPWGCRSSTPGSRPSGAASRSVCSVPAWAAPRSAR
jgi:NNP family nitrate/nitrite transporter-like MFS transporter